MGFDTSMDQLLMIAQLVASPSRLLVLQLLGEGGLCVTDVADQAGLSRSTASYHLSKLVQGGLAVCKRRGRHRVFSWGSTRCSLHFETAPSSTG